MAGFLDDGAIRFNWSTLRGGEQIFQQPYSFSQTFAVITAELEVPQTDGCDW